MEKIQYGLMNKNNQNLIYINKSHNGADRYACGEYTYTLTQDDSDVLWVTDDIDVAKKIVSQKEQDIPGWYNSKYEDPVFEYDISPEDLQVVEIKTIITVIN